MRSTDVSPRRTPTIALTAASVTTGIGASGAGTTTPSPVVVTGTAAVPIAPRA